MEVEKYEEETDDRSVPAVYSGADRSGVRERRNRENSRKRRLPAPAQEGHHQLRNRRLRAGRRPYRRALQGQHLVQG